MSSGFWVYIETTERVRTGRQFGDKRPSKMKEDGGYRSVTSDTWAGPGSYDADQEGYHPSGQYERVTHRYRWVAT